MGNSYLIREILIYVYKDIRHDTNFNCMKTYTQSDCVWEMLSFVSDTSTQLQDVTNKRMRA